VVIFLFLLDRPWPPGGTRTSIITLDGDHEVNECFFDDVKVPFEKTWWVEEKTRAGTCAKVNLPDPTSVLALRVSALPKRADSPEKGRSSSRERKPLIEDTLFRYPGS